MVMFYSVLYRLMIVARLMIMPTNFSQNHIFFYVLLQLRWLLNSFGQDFKKKNQLNRTNSMMFNSKEICLQASTQYTREQSQHNKHAIIGLWDSIDRLKCRKCFFSSDFSVVMVICLVFVMYWKIQRTW